MCADPAPLVVTKQTLISVTQFADQSSLYETDAYLELQLAGAEVSNPEFGEMRRNSSDISKTFLAIGSLEESSSNCDIPNPRDSPVHWTSLAGASSNWLMMDGTES
jgi:hypothetical protein